MGKEIVLLRNKEKMSRQDASELLRTLADKINTGKISLSSGDKNVELIIPDQVEIELKAEKEIGMKKTTKKLEIEIEWLVGGSSQNTGPLVIK